MQTIRLSLILQHGQNVRSLYLKLDLQLLVYVLNGFRSGVNPQLAAFRRGISPGLLSGAPAACLPLPRRTRPT